MSEDVKTESAQDNTEADTGTEVKTEAGKSEGTEPKEMSDRLYPEHGKSEEDSAEKSEDSKEESAEGDDKEEKPKEGEGEDEPKAADKKADEELSLELPEGSHIKQSRLDEIVAESREQGLSKEQAQAKVDQENKAISEYLSTEKSALEARSQAWVEDVKADQEIGGEKFVASVEHAKRVLDKYASDDLKGLLNQTGLGNHPEVVRLFARVGKEMASDSFVAAPAGTVPAKAAKGVAEVLYGNTTPN